MRPDQILIGLLIFGLVIIGAVGIVGSMATDYEVTQDTSVFEGANGSDVDSTYNNVREISNITTQISDKISTQEGVSGSNALNAVIQGIWGVVLLIPKTFGLVNGILNSVGAAIGIPPFITTTIFIIFVIGILFMILYLISNSRNVGG